tara:strand:- start:335 stop:1342 length:1008 start_codon:yes stop_codon:yes gene_type:complete
MASIRLNIIPYNRAFKALQFDAISPFYFLMGEDQFLQQWFIQKITDCLFGNDKVEKMILIPDEMRSNEIMDQLMATDLFNSKKLFILRNPNALKGKVRDEMIDFCQKSTDLNTLVFIQNEYGAKNKFIQSLVRIVNPISCATPFESDMIHWAKFFLKENGIYEVSKPIINTLIEIAGDSLSHLKNEIDKVSILLDDSKELNQEDITQFSGWKRKFRQYEFFNFLGQRRLKESMELGRTMVSQDTTMINLLYPLTEFFQELLFIKISDGTNSVKKGYTRLSPSVNRQLKHYAKQFSNKEITIALKRLGQIDAKLKTSRINDESAITEFLYATLSNG